MNILLAGAAGFVGSHLTEKFLASGHSVIAVDNLSTGRSVNLEPFHFSCGSAWAGRDAPSLSFN